MKPTTRNAVDFARKNKTTCQGTKVPRVSLFNIIRNKNLLAYSGDEHFVLTDVVDSREYKLGQHEKLSDVSFLIVLVQVVWPEFTVLSRKLLHD